MSTLKMAAETETGKSAADFLCTAESRCDTTPVMVVLVDGQFEGSAACAEHLDEIRQYETRNNRVWTEES